MEKVVAPLVAQSGFDLESVSVRSAGRRLQVVITVDGDEVTLDGIAELSTLLSEHMDETNPLKDHAYTLEVTSRGVNKPLTLPRHWRRNIGRLVAVTLKDDTAITGRITAANEHQAEVGGAHVEFAEVARAVIQVEFNPGKES